MQIYSDAAKTTTTYLIPGPRVWSGFAGYTVPPNLPGSTTGSTTAVGSSTAGSGTTTKPTTTSSSASSSTTGAAHYAQCGGTGYR